MIKSGDSGQFIKSNDDFAFPSVKCPAGCYSFVNECTSIPFNHLLAWKFNLSIFGGDPKFLKGARSDWIESRRMVLGKFLVIPGLVVNEEGLSIMLCESHGKGLLKSIIHVPKHPFLGDLGLPFVDTTAAAILTPNVIRNGMLGKWTHSNHVVNFVGGYTGLSTSSIAQRVDLSVLDDRLFGSEFFSAENRPDVFNLLKNKYCEQRNGEEKFRTSPRTI